jgi:hypothetical protein
MNYCSSVERESCVVPGVVFVISRMSFGRRVELTRRLREIAQRVEFLQAGDSRERIDAALLECEIERLYLVWGLREVRGLEIDGAPATPESLAEAGPEDLFREAAGAVKRECGLSEDERKN